MVAKKPVKKTSAPKVSRVRCASTGRRPGRIRGRLPAGGWTVSGPGTWYAAGTRVCPPRRPCWPQLGVPALCVRARQGPFWAEQSNPSRTTHSHRQHVCSDSDLERSTHHPTPRPLQKAAATKAKTPKKATPKKATPSKKVRGQWGGGLVVALLRAPRHHR